MKEDTASWARRYHALGYNPLPSRADVKGPAVQDYGRYRDGERIPEQWLDSWWSSNLQLCLGVPWKLLVVDLDGAEAQFRFVRKFRQMQVPRTWVVRTGAGGIHLYFTIPDHIPAVPSRKVWGRWDPETQDWAPHHWIEVLADKGLIIAPPSVHVDTGLPYEFLPGQGPDDIPRPSRVPFWLLSLQPLHRPTQRPTLATRRPRKTPNLGRPRKSGFVDRNIVLDRLGDDKRLDVAVAAGLRVAGKQNPAGWVPCHSIYRDDIHPSASFCPGTGVYWEFGIKSLSYFDLLVELGAYASWTEACAALESPA